MEKLSPEKPGPEKIVIVLGDRKNPHAHHIKLEGTVRVGRALSSDVILSDEHVEPLQMVFLEQEGVRRVEVMAGINPVLRNGNPVAPGIYDFVSGDEWHIGYTQLQAFHENHVPEPTEKLVTRGYPAGSLAQQALFVLMLVVLLGWKLFASWIGEYEVLEWDQKAAATITDGDLILVFVWAAFWGVIARMVTGKSQFIIHFVAASLFVFVNMASTTAFEYLSYGTNHELFWEILNYTVPALMLAAVLYVALSYALHLRRTRLVALTVGILFSGFVYVDSLIDRNELEPVFNHFVKPPFAVLVVPGTLEQFGLTMEQAFTEVDESAR